MEAQYIAEFRETFLKDIPNAGSDETLAFYLDAAYASIETDLTLILKKQEVNEMVDYAPSDQNRLIRIRTTWPCNKVTGDIEAFFGNTKMINFPKETVVKTQQSYGNIVSRSFHLMPNFNNVATYTGTFFGFTSPASAIQGAPSSTFYGYSTFPAYWHVKYETGFDKIPDDILKLLYMKAARSYLVTLGDTLNGTANNSEQLEVDGIKQNIYKQQGQYGPFSGRINMYLKEEENSLRRLKAKYVGVRFGMI